MADVDLVLRGAPTATGGTTATVTGASRSDTTVGDYVLVTASADYVAATNLTIAASTGVVNPDDGSAGWKLLHSVAGTNLSVRFWLGRVTTAGARSVAVSQGSGTSGLHVHVYTLNASSGTVTLDGSPTSITNDTTSPFTHSAVTTAGTKSLLIAAHGQVQFSATTAYGAAPTGMTGLANYVNSACGLQSCYQVLTAAGSTGTRDQTSTPTTVAGTGGGMLALRAESVEPQLVETYPATASSSPTTLTTASFTPRENEVLTVKVTAGSSASTIGVPSAPGITFTARGNETTTNYTPTRMFTAVVPANPGSITVSVPVTGSAANSPTALVERWAYAQLAGTPAQNATRTGTATAGSPVGTPNATITPTSASSVLTWIAADYVPVTTGTPTYRGTATSNYSRRDANINVWSAWQRAGATSAQTIGMTAPTAQKWTMIGIELQPGPAPVEAAPNTGSAAGNFAWGTALPCSDEFDYTGAPDPARWGVYNGPGHAGNGTRDAARCTVGSGYLRITGQAGGSTGGLASLHDQRYGRWEVRARWAAQSGATGNKYHPVLIVWPESELWPLDGEYDFIEQDIGDTLVKAFLHYPHPVFQDNHVEQIGVTGPTIDQTQFHNYAFEWTADGLRGWVDGVQWFTVAGGASADPATRRDDVQNMPSGHLCMQLDNFFPQNGLQAADMDIEWARVYSMTPGPGVFAGGNSTGTVGSAFTRTALESESGVTSRSWTIAAGPAGTGTEISTAAALSWTPSVPGAYTLRYTAVNPSGTSTDTIRVVVADNQTPARRVSLAINPTLADAGAPAWFGPSGAARIEGITGFDRTTGFDTGTTAGQCVTARFPVTGGEVYTSSLYGRADTQDTGVTWSINWYDAGGSFIPAGVKESNQQSGTASAGAVQRFSVTALAPPTAVQGLMTMTRTARMILTQHMVERGSTLGSYFDQQTSGATATGTPNASTTTYSANATTANAATATATGTALSTTELVRAAPPAVASAGTAVAPSERVRPAPPTVTATGAAQAPVTAGNGQAPAQTATAIGAALAPSERLQVPVAAVAASSDVPAPGGRVADTAPVVAGTGAALAPVATGSAPAPVIGASGTSLAPSERVAVTPGVAGATGSGNPAIGGVPGSAQPITAEAAGTVAQSSPRAAAPAGVAPAAAYAAQGGTPVVGEAVPGQAGPGAAGPVRVVATPVVAIASAMAPQPVARTATPVGTGTASGAAAAAGTRAGAQPPAAAGATTAVQPSDLVRIVVGSASAAASAPAATGNPGGRPGSASATGTVPGPAGQVRARAAAATAAGSALVGTEQVTPQVGVGAAAGDVPQTAPAAAARPGTATASGTAAQATVSTSIVRTPAMPIAAGSAARPSTSVATRGAAAHAAGTVTGSRPRTAAIAGTAVATAAGFGAAGRPGARPAPAGASAAAPAAQVVAGARPAVVSASAAARPSVPRTGAPAGTTTAAAQACPASAAARARPAAGAAAGSAARPGPSVTRVAPGAAAAGSVQPSGSRVRPGVGTASGASSAAQPSETVGVRAGVATASGSALGARSRVLVAVPVCSAAGAAAPPSGRAAVRSGMATATAVAHLLGKCVQAAPAATQAAGVAVPPGGRVRAASGASAASAGTFPAGPLGSARPAAAAAATSAQPARPVTVARPGTATASAVVVTTRARSGARPPVAVCSTAISAAGTRVAGRLQVAAASTDVVAPRGPDSWVRPWRVRARRVDDVTGRLAVPA